MSEEDTTSCLDCEGTGEGIGGRRCAACGGSGIERPEREWDGWDD